MREKSLVLRHDAFQAVLLNLATASRRQAFMGSADNVLDLGCDHRCKSVWGANARESSGTLAGESMGSTF